MNGWRKSSHSGYNNSCVEAGDGPGVTAVRDSADPDGPVLTFTPAAWREFTERIRGGRP